MPERRLEDKRVDDDWLNANAEGRGTRSVYAADKEANKEESDFKRRYATFIIILVGAVPLNLIYFAQTYCSSLVLWAATLIQIFILCALARFWDIHRRVWSDIVFTYVVIKKIVNLGF